MSSHHSQVTFYELCLLLLLFLNRVKYGISQSERILNGVTTKTIRNGHEVENNGAVCVYGPIVLKLWALSRSRRISHNVTYAIQLHPEYMIIFGICNINKKCLIVYYSYII